MSRKPKVAGASSSQAPYASGASSSQAEKREQDAPATINTREQDAPATMWDYFNPLSEIDIRDGGNLPHWEQGSVWYFITFRLADALPKTVADDLRQQREQWKQTHDLDNLTPEQVAEYHRLFSQRYEDLINAGHGSCVLRDLENARIVQDALTYFEGKRYALDEFIVMPNHVHLLVKPYAGQRLVKIVHSWKSYTANAINKRMGRTGQLWQHESYDHIVRNVSAMHAIRRYIRENPKVAGASSSHAPYASGASTRLSSSQTSSRTEKREQDAPATIENHNDKATANDTFGNAS